MYGKVLAFTLSVCSFMHPCAAARPTGCSEFEVEQPRQTGGPVLKAEDFGVSPDNPDNAAALNRAIAECRRVKASKLVVKKGTYKCHGPSGIVIDGLEDFVLDGGDSLFLFWRKHPNDWDAKKHHPESTSPEGSGPCLLAKNCKRVRVENVKSDWDWAVNPLGFLARCVNKHVDERDNESYVDFELMGPDRHPFYPNPVPLQLVMPMNADGSNARMDGSGARCYIATAPGLFGSRNEWIAPNKLRVWVYVPMADRSQGGGLGTGGNNPIRNRGACRGFNIGGVFSLSHYYYGMGGVHLDSNRHFTLRNYSLWSCRGHGLGIGGTAQYTWLDNFRLAPPDPAEVKAYGAGGAYRRSVTATSDGTHVGRCLGYVKLTNCEWSMHNDDSVNFHDCSTIARTVASNKVQVVNNFGTPYLGAKVGHEIELRQENYAITGWRGKIVAMDRHTFTFDRPLPKQTGLFFVLFDREYSTEHLYFKNCLFHKTPWARNLILASNVTFDGCRFEDTLGSPLRFQTCYTYNVWCEGTGCTNVVVRNCLFKNCADFYTVNGVSSQIFTGVRVPDHRGWPERESCPIADAQLKADVEARLAKGAAADVIPSGDVINSILVENNEFVNPRGCTWYAFNGDRLAFSNNRIVFDGTAPYALRDDAGKFRPDTATRTFEGGNTVERKPRLFAMRFDDNKSPEEWNEVAEIFEKEGLRCSFAVCASTLNAKQVECLRELAARGHEIMDHTPQHAMFRITYPDAESFAAGRSRPYVAQVDEASRTVRCRPELNLSHPSAFKFRASIVKGKLEGLSPEALKRLTFSRKFFDAADVTKGYGVRKSDDDSRPVADFWGRDVREDVSEREFILLDQQAITTSKELRRDQAALTRRIFDKYGLPRPTFWIQPGGWEAFLDWRRLKEVYGDEFGYIGADACVDSPPIPGCGANQDGLKRRWAFRPGWDYFDQQPDIEKVKANVAKAMAQGRPYYYISHQWTRRLPGGRAEWLAKTREFAAWLREAKVPMGTVSQVARGM